MRSGKVAAISEGEWCGPSDSKNGVPPVWVGFWDDDEPPHGARSTIWLAGTDTPSRAVVRWKEFAQRNNDGDLVGLWPTMPAHMLHKVALALNLRRAVPDILPRDLILYTENDAEGDKVGDPPLEDHRVVDGDSDGVLTCACGERFNTAWGWKVHHDQAATEIPGPAPTAGHAPAGAAYPPPAPAGPGRTYKSRKTRPVETGPPVDYYDNLPEARGMS
jgi:hypothetical protein